MYRGEDAARDGHALRHETQFDPLARGSPSACNISGSCWWQAACRRENRRAAWGGAWCPSACGPAPDEPVLASITSGPRNSAPTSGAAARMAAVARQPGLATQRAARISLAVQFRQPINEFRAALAAAAATRDTPVRAPRRPSAANRPTGRWPSRAARRSSLKQLVQRGAADAVRQRGENHRLLGVQQPLAVDLFRHRQVVEAAQVRMHRVDRLPGLRVLVTETTATCGCCTNSRSSSPAP